MFFFLAVIESWLHVFLNMPWQVSFIDTCICLYRLLLCQKIQTKKIQLVLLEWQNQLLEVNLEVVASFSCFIVVKWMEVSISQVCSTSEAINTYRQKEKVTSDFIVAVYNSGLIKKIRQTNLSITDTIYIIISVLSVISSYCEICNTFYCIYSWSF